MNDLNLSPSTAFEKIATAVCERLAKNERVRRSLPGKGRLRIDRQLPFLCIYRSPVNVGAGNVDGNPDAGTQQLVTTEASYLFASGAEEYQLGLNHLCQRLNAIMQEHFGTFLFLEVWAEREPEGIEETLPLLQPAFEIVTPDLEDVPDTINALREALEEITMGEHHARVTSRKSEHVGPPHLAPLQHVCRNHAGGCFVIGLAVRPIYQDPHDGTLFPMILQKLRTQLAFALRKAIWRFTGFESSSHEVHYQSLGPTSLVKAARLVDQQLCEVSECFDFILQVTPTNSEEAWIAFQESEYQTEPMFRYRPLPYSPNQLKRRLFDIEIERIEDPTLAYLFREKQDEIDRQLTTLRELGTSRFLPGSVQIYGVPDDDLVKLALEILRHFPACHQASSTNQAVESEYLPVSTVIERAREEIDFYHQQMSEFNAKVELCDHIAAGIMVSHDRLLIAESVKISPHRLEPLLHHEIGTHLLTYFNGRCQPFRQLYAGLAGYDELQEGLAVMAEYLTGGLTAGRLRMLAGRVIAVHSMINHESFLTTFHRLCEGFGFSAHRAFTTTLRVYRGGGLTKDLIYLRGLRDLLDYLSKGHDIEPLYVGKIGLQHLPYVQEMRRRGIIDAPGVLPRFWDDDELHDRLETCRGLSVVELAKVN